MLLRYETARGQAGVNDKVQAPSHININDGTMSVNCEKILKSEQESGLQPSTYYVHTEVARHGEHGLSSQHLVVVSTIIFAVAASSSSSNSGYYSLLNDNAVAAFHSHQFQFTTSLPFRCRPCHLNSINHRRFITSSNSDANKSCIFSAKPQQQPGFMPTRGTLPIKEGGGGSRKKQQSIFSTLGKEFQQAFPPPQDSIVLSGDILALLVYTYLDHYLNSLVLEAKNTAITTASADVISNTLLHSPPSSSISSSISSLITTPSTDMVSLVPYAPAVAAPGMAFVILASCWVGCGVLSGAFQFSNTRDCDPTWAMIVTLRTWAGTAFLVVLIALLSDATVAGVFHRANIPMLDYGTYYSDELRHTVLQPYIDGRVGDASDPRGGLTRADADYIFDSLSVLAFWRLMYNWMLGYYYRR